MPNQDPHLHCEGFSESPRSRHWRHHDLKGWVFCRPHRPCVLPALGAAVLASWLVAFDIAMLLYFKWWLLFRVPASKWGACFCLTTDSVKPRATQMRNRARQGKFLNAKQSNAMQRTTRKSNATQHELSNANQILNCMLMAAGLGKTRQVGSDRKSFIAGYWQLG